MVTCSCGKVMEKVPSWLQGTKVDFVCNNCPNRSAKNIAFVTLEPEVKKVGALDEPEVEEEADDEL